ncbi:MAG: RHS repeat-associated core domain-containing protein [Anaerolineaceae bacterium]|nr:RHS repeat-associated core domain-containing protein [Anaerolineaceae bacterium]
MYFYNARWYDPEVGRFIQADTIIPEPGVPLAWDRYAYGYNNPVNRVDPSGHRPCENGNCQINPLQYKVENDFGWILEDDWSGKEIQQVYVASQKVFNYVNNVTSGRGQQWMDMYLGFTIFKHGNFPGKPDYSYVTGSTIHVTSNWQGNESNHIIHELGHVYDNNTQGGGVCLSINGCGVLAEDITNGRCDATICGGGNADFLQYAIGGIPTGNRALNGVSGVPQGFQWGVASHGRLTYGDTGTAEYFAEAFMYMVVDQSKIPQSSTIVNIMNSFIFAEASN